MKFEIKCRFTARVLFETEAVSLKAAVEKAVEMKVSLAGANLAGANLAGANLAYANLAYANLAVANLARANLARANLAGANLADSKSDYMKVLSVAKNEVLGLYDALMRGKIDGTVYQSECACLVGTIANIRHEKHDALAIDLRPNADRPAEKWFLNIRRGDIPQNNEVSRITALWTEEFMKAENIIYPSYEIVAVKQPEGGG